VLNEAPLHEDVWGSASIPPPILNFGSRWRWVVSFTPRKLYPEKRAPITHWTGGWVDPEPVWTR